MKIPSLRLSDLHYGTINNKLFSFTLLSRHHPAEQRKLLCPALGVVRGEHRILFVVHVQLPALAVVQRPSGLEGSARP